jgi:carbon-monoxide dehydrogenase medium subunit
LKAAAVAYARPATVAEAVALLAEHGEEARLLAGGQSLVTSLNMRLSAPSLLIDLNHIPHLSGIERRDGIVRIGAMTRHRDLGASEIVREHLPLVSAAVPHIAHPAIRNRGTIGGSLALADPATELPACCLALDATLVVVGPSGERRIAVGDFFLGLYTTALAPDEILVSVEIPAQPKDAVWGFEELARRHGDYALAGIAAAARRAGSGLADARIAVFGVGDRPVLATKAASALSDGDVRAAQDTLSAEIDPADDVALKGATRKHLARVILGRVASQMLGGT